MKKLREPASSITHMIGAGLSVVGLGYLVYLGSMKGPWHLASFITFGVSLVLLYTASSVYHAVKASEKAVAVLRKVDHVMIFVLIAGSYTPFCLLPLRGPWGWSLLGTIWGLALVGAVTKLFWMHAPRWLSTGFYLLMGWLVVVAVYPMVQSVATPSLILLALGGFFYTAGAILYGTKWPNPWPGRFGFHEIWHLFVMAGSTAHFAAVALL
ncbi:MAG: hemolysin III family protein [Firmicutes bacterium]|nr:hemolysin III family protein [Bacillota bacterium]